MTTAEPMLVLKKVMVASQPLPGETREQLLRGRFKEIHSGVRVKGLTTLPSREYR